MKEASFSPRAFATSASPRGLVFPAPPPRPPAPCRAAAPRRGGARHPVPAVRGRRPGGSARLDRRRRGRRLLQPGPCVARSVAPALSCVASEGGSVRGSPCGEPARLRTGLTVPPVLPTAGVPQGAHYVREWGAPPPAATPPDPPVLLPDLLTDP